MSFRRRITIALVGLILIAGIGWLARDLSGDSGGGAPHGGAVDRALVSVTVPGSRSALATRAMSTLPPQVAATYRLVLTGGPFPYPAHDGAVFGNLEHALPARAAGYYHEYTVATPHAADRGARRLIIGADHEVYYTADHYRSFVVVDPLR